MKKVFLYVFVIFSLGFTNYQHSQGDDLQSLFLKFLEYYKSGDFVNAEKMLLLSFKLKEPLTIRQLSSTYNNLGATYTLLGRYKEALDYYSKAEALEIKNRIDEISLGSIYINMAIIYETQRSFSQAIEYFEKGIRFYIESNVTDVNSLTRVSNAYHNLGVTYYEIGNYQEALRYLEKSSRIKEENNLYEKTLVYLSLAKAHARLNNNNQADNYFKRSIESAIEEYGENYFRLAEVYFGYGQFLQKIGKASESLKIFRKSLMICLETYGEKNTLTSLAFKYMGDFYLSINSIDSSLFYYQRSLISVVNDFNSYNISENPGIDSSLFDIRLLDNLKRKSYALEILALRQVEKNNKILKMNSSLETIELALKLVDIIRGNYLTEESRIYLAENEKETYISAVRIAASLYSLSKGDSLNNKVYSIAQKAKAAILREEITGNDLLYSSAVSDTLRRRQTWLTSTIAGYNKLLSDETRLKTKPDSSKIDFWKDRIFEMNRERRQLAQKIADAIPRYYDLIRKTDPVSPVNIQKQLKKNETIVDYLVSNLYSDGKRKLYIFLITGDNLTFCETELDTMFVKNARILKNTSDPAFSANDKSHFTDYIGALNYMYKNLILPVEGLFQGRRLIIIPDEEIEWLPFEAFLKNLPEGGTTDFEGLPYLITDYTFSYSYSSSLLFNNVNHSKRGIEVISFSPSYSDSGTELGNLTGAASEIEKVHNLFDGKIFTGDNASKNNFLKSIQRPAIFHLAMHSMSDTINSRFSYMLFDSPVESEDSGKLYNYEISLSRLISPMVVLSACNSGTGTLNSGEGQMSLARSFILAGASSVVKTAWEVNDQSSSEIITRFYFYLSKGKEKDEALRLAKFDYLQKSSPAFTNPYYWAAYEVLGDIAPVTSNKKLYTRIIILLSGIVAAAGLIYYFRRRKISLEGFW